MGRTRQTILTHRLSAKSNASSWSRTSFRIGINGRELPAGSVSGSEGACGCAAVQQGRPVTKPTVAAIPGAGDALRVKRCVTCSIKSVLERHRLLEDIPLNTLLQDLSWPCGHSQTNGDHQDHHCDIIEHECFICFNVQPLR